MRRGMALAALVLTLVLGAALVSVASAPRLREPTVIRVIEHATTDTVIDVGTAGDSTGDLLTFANKVYNASDTEVVGRDQGDCIRIDPAKGTWECRWTTWLEGGKITVEGPFFDTHDSVIAVTGGTGRFRNARGSMVLRAREGGTKFLFAFALLP